MELLIIKEMAERKPELLKNIRKELFKIVSNEMIYNTFPEVAEVSLQALLKIENATNGKQNKTKNKRTRSKV
jgi:hypothetical protein